MNLNRREVIAGLVGAAALEGCGPESQAEFESQEIPEAASAYQSINRAMPESAFEAERILPFYSDDPVRLRAGQPRRVLVIGGGLAGLSAALELAERGYQVVLKEGAPYFGGRLHTRTERLRTGTFRVEHGLHMWFHQYYNFSDLFQRLGLTQNLRGFEEVYFRFRDYQPELLKSVGPYPFNLINIIKTSPNLNLLDAAATFGAAKDIVFYNHASNYQNFDNISFVEWGRRTNANKKFWDVLLAPAASVTLNDPTRISAAEMLLYMHYFFIGHPRAFRRRVTTTDHGTAVIDPWVARLRQLGVDLRVNARVSGLRVAGGRVVGEVGDTTAYNAVVLATDMPGTKAILGGSVAADERSLAALAKVQGVVRPLGIAPHYKVLRAWFDRSTGDRPFSQSVIESSQFRPINLLAFMHMLETESADWARRTGGSIVEFHLYNTPELRGLGADQVWERIKPVALELVPQLTGARALDFSMGSYDNFTSFEVGQGLNRPVANYPRLKAGLANLTLAGDWVHTLYPSALMERAVSTGREAANDIALQDRVRQAVVYTAKNNGPGLLPRF
jgi:carotenoid phi-ring synthase / carotenoid chi-ring synthase